FAERIDLERENEVAVAGTDGLLFQIDHETKTRESLHFIEQLVDLRFGQHDRQQAVLVAVVEEDIGEAGRDDGAEAVLAQRPRRMFARRTAAEILARQQDGSTLIARLVQHEIRIQRTRGIVPARFTDIQITPFVEQVRTEAAALDRFQKLFRDDRIGIHIGAIQRRHQSVEKSKFFHAVQLQLVMTATAIAVTAVRAQNRKVYLPWIFSPTCSTSLPKPFTVLQPANSQTEAISRRATFFMFFSPLVLQLFQQ